MAAEERRVRGLAGLPPGEGGRSVPDAGRAFLCLRLRRSNDPCVRCERGVPRGDARGVWRGARVRRGGEQYDLLRVLFGSPAFLEPSLPRYSV